MSTNGDQPTGAMWARWLIFRRVVTFLLGVAVILDSLIEKSTATVGKLVVGLLLIGVPAFEDIADLMARRPSRRAERKAARETD